MASRDFGFTTLRNFTAYQPDGSRVPNDYILTISSGGGGKFSNIINPSTVNAHLINVNILDADILSTTVHFGTNIITSSLIAEDYVEAPLISSLLVTTSTLCVETNALINQNLNVLGTYTGNLSIISSLNASTINVSSINIVNNLNTSTIFSNLISTHNIRTNFISTFGYMVFIDNNNSTVTIDNVGQDLFVNGFPLITEGNISSISSLYWEDDFGSGTLAGGIFNKNLGQGAQGYMVGIGTLADIRGTLSVKYAGGDNSGSPFHISSNNNFLYAYSDNQSPNVNGLDLRIQENQNTDFAASLDFIKTKDFLASDPTSELGYISFYGTNNVQNTVRGGYIMGRQSGVASTFTPMDLQFFTNTSSIEQTNPSMVINKDGNVGIRTSNPYTRLQTVVVNQTGLDGIASQSADVNTIIGGYSIGNFSGQNVGSIQVTSGNQAYNNWPLALNPRGGTVYIGSSISNTYVLSNTLNTSTIVANGNVGIGFQIPQYPLDVSGFGHFSTTGGVILLEPDGNTTGNVIRYGGGGPVANNLIFRGAGDFEKMRITPSGNVGIGTNNPQSLLDVNGSIRAAAGSAVSPGIFFSTDLDTGLYGIADGQMGICANGQQRLKITNNNIDITPLPGQPVTIANSNNNGYTILNVTNQGTTGTAAEIALNTGNGGYGIYACQAEGSVGGLTASTFQIWSYFPGASNIFTLYPNGQLNLGGGLNATGNIFASGNVTAGSDIRFKTQINTLENALSTVNNLRGVSYYSLDTKVKNIGVIAQEVEKFLPEVVLTDSTKDQYKSVAYGNMVGLLIEAVKELSDKVNNLENKINSR